MKMNRKFFIYMITVLSILTVTFGTGCSYVSDTIEGLITNRASFSIDVAYDSSSEIISITWDENGGSDFAGFEVYVTETRDDEYSGYELVASRHALPSGTYAGDLSNKYSGSFSYNVSSIVNGVFPKGPGTYFYRIGIIKWDDDEKDRTSDNGYVVDSNGTWLDNDVNYNNKTEIDQISGAAMVDIY